VIRNPYNPIAICNWLFSLDIIACSKESGYHWSMDDNTFECPNCGATVYPEMTRCPHCGQTMYPEDVPDESIIESNPEPGWAASFGAVLVGWMVAAGLMFLINFIVARFVIPPLSGGLARFILFLAAPLGAAVGGFVSASLVRRNCKVMGGIIGALAIPVSLLLATHWTRVSLSFLLDPWIFGTCVLTIIAGVFGGWLRTAFNRSADWQEKWKIRGWEDMLYQELLRKVRFNGSTADRLIEYERNQKPEASRLELIQNAIQRLDRDNR
jgi:hypothetical protein